MYNIYKLYANCSQLFIVLYKYTQNVAYSFKNLNYNILANYITNTYTY